MIPTLEREQLREVAARAFTMALYGDVALAREELDAALAEAEAPLLLAEHGFIPAPEPWREELVNRYRKAYALFVERFGEGEAV